MGQSPSSMRSKSGRRRSFRAFVRRSKLNKSSLSHTFNLPPSEEYPELMNINIATEEQLMTLPGVSRQLAREIVRHRQMIGRFKRVDDLALVSGIGAEKLELLRPEICTNTRKQISRASSCTQSLESIRFTENKLYSVNSSSVFQLQCIPGLNQEIAANIVEYRNKKGPFKSLDDLIKVRGMDIVRLSTVKPNLTLEPRKCESVQNLNNGHSNGFTNISFNESLMNGVTSTPRTPHRKTLSMPTKFPVTLPNGFAAAPVNDILDLLSAYSHRPIVEEVFTYERGGVRCCRLASWNLHQLSVDKILNPGVREVICRTILENTISLIAVQDVLEEKALKILLDELNGPSIRRVREWRSNSYKWEYCISQAKNRGHHQRRLELWTRRRTATHWSDLDSTTPVSSDDALWEDETRVSRYLGFIYDSANKGITIEDIELEQMCLLIDDEHVKLLVEELRSLRSDRYIADAQAFLLCGRPIVLINIHCRDRLSEADTDRLRNVADLADQVKVQLAFLGEFLSWDNIASLKPCESLLVEDIATTLDPNTEGKTAIVCPTSIDKSNFNGRYGVVKSGLSHLAIPRGWSWGGPASPYYPVWTELNVPD